MWSLSTCGDKQKLKTSLSLQREDFLTFGLTTGDEVGGNGKGSAVQCN
jgi:hypothetical protein